MTNPYPPQQPEPHQQGMPEYPQQYQPKGTALPQPAGPVDPGPGPLPAKPNRKPLIVAAAAAVATLMLATAGYAVYDGFIKEDSGVAACKAMRDGRNVDGSTDDSDDKISEAEYREVRELFEDSRHDDIREHGTALMDVVWQVSQLPEGQEMAALAYMGPLTTHMSGLQTACADQDVIVNLNKK